MSNKPSLSRSPLRALEVAAALAVIATTVLHCMLYAEKLASCSMHTDELGSVVSFTAKGPWYAMTHYPIPRNHILFSALASTLPGAGRLDPLCARSLSFGVAILLGVSILAAYLRRGRWLEAALMFALWGLNGELIHLGLQARGYGLLCLFAFFSSLLAVRYAERRALADFAWLGLCTMLGAYTVPAYVCFGAPLMLLLVLQERDLKAFGLTVATAALIGLLYLPVAGQLLAAMASYKAKYGEFYTGFSAVVETVRLFVWPLPAWPAMLLFAATLVAPFAIRSESFPARKGLQALCLAVGVFLGACLVLRTPPVRTTAFVALPLGFCLVETVGWGCRRVLDGLARADDESQQSGSGVPPMSDSAEGRRHFWARACSISPGHLRLAFCALFLAGGTGAAMLEIARFQFVPYEDWAGAWRFIATMFPPGTPVDCSRLADGLTYYMDQDRYRIKLDSAIDPGFAEGTVPVVAAPFVRGVRWFNPARYAASWAVLTVPGRVRNVSIYFAIPPEKRVMRVSRLENPGAPLFFSGSTAATIASAETLDVELDASSPSHSLNLLFEHAPDDLEISALRTGASGKSAEIAPDRIVRVGDGFTLPLDGVPLSRVVLRLHTAEQAVRLRAIWATLTNRAHE